MDGGKFGSDRMKRGFASNLFFPGAIPVWNRTGKFSCRQVSFNA
jgi:hypothetical protein